MGLFNFRQSLWKISLCLVLLAGCSRLNPSGTYSGVLKDWVHEVFTGILIADGLECDIRLELSQGQEKNLAELTFIHPKMSEIKRSGNWEVGDGERVITMDDGKEPSEYFLIKRGVRYAFQTKVGLANDDGSSLLLMRHEGLSRKASFPVEIHFGQDKEAEVRGVGGNPARKGTWNWMGERMAVVVKMPGIEDGEDNEVPAETYKYILRWSSSKPSALELEKLIIMRPFLKNDGSKRQSWMSSLIFPEPPLLKPN